MKVYKKRNSPQFFFYLKAIYKDITKQNQMKITTADIYHKVINRISKTEKISIEEATEIVNKHETWLIDSVEAFGEKNVSQLASCIFDMHCDEVNN